MPGGRPTDYKPEYAEMLREHFNIDAWTKDGEGKYIPGSFPTLAGFACKVNVCRQTLLNWADQHEEFFDALKMAKEHQERILVENGLLGVYDKTFAIFTAKNLIDWRDKVEQQHTGANGGPIEFKDVPDSELQAKLDKLLGLSSAKPSGD